MLKLGTILLSLLSLTACLQREFGAGNGAGNNVTLYWSAPLERANGDVMLSSDIGGYEIRYRHTNDTFYSIIVLDASSNQHSIDNLPNPKNLIFEVAVFDTDGIYSNFVTANEGNQHL